MIWIFGLIVGLIWKLPVTYWVIGFLCGLMAEAANSSANKRSYAAGKLYESTKQQAYEALRRHK